MRLALVAALLVACELPSLDTERCAGDDTFEHKIVPGPDCNGLRYASACAEAGLPSGYGVEKGCPSPAIWGEGNCASRPGGLEGCVPFMDLLCCP